MSEQFSNGVDVRTASEHIYCETVAECPRAYCRIEVGLYEILVHLSADASRTESLPVLIDEENPVGEIRVALCPFVFQHDIVLQRLDAGRPDWNDSFFLA